MRCGRDNTIPQLSIMDHNMNPNWTNFLATQGWAADDSHFGRPLEELAAARDGAVLAPLADFGLIRASGPDAAGFLHNLMSNDIQGIDAVTARVAGLCTPKGRLLAIFLVWREGEDFLLMLPQEILPPILKKMSMFVFRSKVKLSDATADRVLIGVSPAPTFFDAIPPRFTVAPTAGGQAIQLDAPRALLCLTPEAAIARWPELAAKARPIGTDAWRWLEIAAGQPRIVAAAQELFVPQMLNMDLPGVAGVSFTKGCYPGQEIVARTHYLGKVKRRMVRAHIDRAIAPGTHVYAPETGDQQCGALLSLAPSPEGGFDGLVSVQSTAVEAGEVHLGTPDGERLTFLPLPYAGE